MSFIREDYKKKRSKIIRWTLLVLIALAIVFLVIIPQTRTKLEFDNAELVQSEQVP